MYYSLGRNLDCLFYFTYYNHTVKNVYIFPNSYVRVSSGNNTEEESLNQKCELIQF